MFVENIRAINAGHCCTPKGFHKGDISCCKQDTPIYIFYFEINGKKCVYDTGYTDFFNKETKTFPNSMYRMITPTPCDIKPALDFSEIDYVFISHFHADHVSGLKLCTKARFIYIDRKINKTLFGAYLKGLIPDDFEDRSIKVKIADYKSRSFLSDNCKIISLPGHSAEHMGLILNNRYFLVGDAVWCYENFRFLTNPLSLTRLIHNNLEMYDKTIIFLRDLSLTVPELNFYPSHDRFMKHVSFDKTKFKLVEYSHDYLITGATGFLGGALAKYFKDKGYSVIGVGRNKDKLAKLRKYGIETMEKINGTKVTPKYVIHCAAECGQNKPWYEYYESNVLLTRKVIDRFQSSKKIIYVSSPSVYFNSITNDHLNVKEDFIPESGINKTHYSYYKLLGEKECMVHNNFTRKNIIIVRPRGLYGPNDNNIIPKLVTALEKKRLPQIGNGENIVSLTYIDNAVNAIDKVIEHGTCGDVYNIADEPVKQWDFINKFAVGIGFDKPSFYVPLNIGYLLSTITILYSFICSLFDYYPELSFLPNTITLFGKSITLDTNKLKTKCKYKQLVSNEEALRKTIDHTIENLIKKVKT